jgi:putative integral membrane protein (TIGR02587 family)
MIPASVDETLSGGRATVDIGRAFAGALLFSLPLLMTMEMWWLGFYMSPLRLVLLLVVTFPLLVGLSRYGGFRPTGTLAEGIVDALVALAVAAVAAILILYLFGVLQWGMSAREIVGKIGLQMVPGSIGAMLARNQLGRQEDGPDKERKRHPSYGGELFLMAVGALFLSLNVAPTEEMVLIAYQMSFWHELGLIALSLALMHAFVYRLGFVGQEEPGEHETFWSLLARFTIAGYVIVLLMSLFALWTFERTAGLGTQEILSAAVVLAFPGAIGAAMARLVL